VAGSHDPMQTQEKYWEGEKGGGCRTQENLSERHESAWENRCQLFYIGLVLVVRIGPDVDVIFGSERGGG